VHLREVFCLERRHETLFTLRQIVFGQLRNSARQQHDGYQIDGCHKPHQGVSYIEHSPYCLYGFPDNHAQSSQAQSREARQITRAYS
jgi:hypothetical protein